MNPHYRVGSHTPMSGRPETQFLYFYHPDHLGSTEFVTDTDGELYEHAQYFPSGETWVREDDGADRLPWLFTSQELDADTGLYYLNARYYDPRVGTFASCDPVLAAAIRAQPAPTVFTPANLSSFSYVGGRLTGAIDVSGRNTIFLGGAGYESETRDYAEAIVARFLDAGIAGPQYVPISSGGQAGNIARTLAYRFGRSPSYRESVPRRTGAITPRDPEMTNVVDAAMAASTAEGGRNLVGYSYGSVVAAHAALDLAARGETIDNLVLIGTPIAADSELYRALLETGAIRHVIGCSRSQIGPLAGCRRATAGASRSFLRARRR
jgi:RHS repeat-associated protein